MGLRIAVVGVLTSSLLVVAAQRASGAVQTRVSLDFDGNTISQYTLAYQQALQPHNAPATFYVNSGTVGGSGNFMSWTQLSALAAAGNDIGGKSVNATNLTTDPNPTAQVCNDRAALLQHGLTPVGFAYPGGATNASVKAIVKGCGYGNARTAGSLSPTGPTYAETLPPADWFGERAYAPTHPTLANLQSLVTGASTHNGGWIHIVVGKVCSQTADPSNYTTCSGSSGSMELADLNSFLDWMNAAGQSNGAPAGSLLSGTAATVNPVDASAPVTTIACNGSACQSTPYSGVVSVTLAATDTGSGVSSTHYTTDGSDPTPLSPTYTGAFNVNGSSASTTVKYRSFDYAGNAEAVNTQVVQAPVDSTAPVTTITCNSSTCTSAAYVATVTVALSATDTGGSGVSGTFYTTDGSTPTTSSTRYTAPFALNSPSTYNVQFFSTDAAGNAEPVQSQQIRVTPVTTRVSLTFDNGSVAQYTLGYTQALQPHGAKATFFVNSGTISVSGNSMTWAQLAALAAAGNDIGGKSVSATDLTTDANPTAQVCDDRKALIQHGLTPAAFAYPGGKFNATIEGIVKNCGYGNGRSAGSLSPTGPTYAETLPPRDWYATRAYAPAGQISLTSMENLVSGAASHGGGWSQIVIGRVCSQTADPNAYAACSASSGWIDLGDLNSFLDWMAAAGTPGGAPAGASLSTVRDAAISADTTAPTTTAQCNAAACSSSTYTSTVSVTLSATDPGSGVASTRYTTDGSAPTTTSAQYTAPIPVTATTTIRFASWDAAGNAEAPNSVTINASLPTDTTPPTTTILCDGSPCTGAGYNGSTTVTLNASDGSGYGVAQTYYTTDGTTPTTSSATYSGPFTLSTQGTYTVQAFSVDLAGNVETVQSQQIVVLAPKVVVSLTFDDGLENQYTLGFHKALQPHHLVGTFYNVSGLNGVDPQHMTWDELTALNDGGNEIGGHTVDHMNLKLQPDPAVVTHEVCDDRQNLINHGFDPVDFAYPEGAYNATDETIVQNCGWSSGRAAGGIDVAGEGAGPVYAETLPPKDMFATRTGYDPPSGTPPNVPPLGLSHLQAQVNGAAAHGGGWITIVLHQICSQTLDPDNYASCIADWGPIELSTLNDFLNWLQNAGQPNGAPARTSVETVRQVLIGPDTQAPVTTLKCDGSACQPSTYSGSTMVSLTARDPGGTGAAATYFTTDGTTPTTSSPVFVRPFTINQPTTFKFFSVDNSGNVEPVQTLQVNVAPNTDPVVGSAGDIACDPSQIAFNGGLGTDTDCRAIDTVKLLKGVDTVLPLGDDQYNCGGTQAFAESYDTSWGMVKSITRPVPGDQDYNTTGGTDCPTVAGAGYFQYFGAAAGDPAKGYYSYDLGQWHVVAINTAPCGNDPTTCQAGSAQEQWLKQDLAAHPTACTLAYYQNPRWASNVGANGNATYQAIWQDLYDGGVDVVLNGDSHWYERFAPMNGAGQADAATGVREFIVGTGGQGLDTPGTQIPTSQVLNDTTHGVIRLTLHASSYDWNFVPDEGTFTDSGTANCHGTADAVPPTTAISCNGTPCGTGFYGAAVQASLTAADNAQGSGVDKTYYTTDGSTPTTASTVYTAPFAIATTATVKYFSVDKSGNAEAVKSQQINVDTTAPTTTASCNGAACVTNWYTAPVQFGLAATDTAGTGVSKTYYTTDGSAPTTSSAVYSAPITVSATTTIRYFSTDLANNAETPKSATVQVDTAAPTTTLTCNGTACASTAYPAAVTATLSAADGTGGSGVASIHYTTNGTTPLLTSPTYTAPLTVSGTTTLNYRAWDVAGNAEVTKTKLITITDQPPAVSFTLTPTSGVAPFSVTANASASTDTDSTPIKNYRFSWGDGTTAVTQTTPTATHTYNAAGTFTVTVTVTDTANLSASSTKTVTSKANLIANSGFETNTTGWASGSTNVTLAQVTGGHTGTRAAALTTGATAGTTATLTDSPNRVSTTAAGTYTATLWVRGATAGATLSLTLTELNRSNVAVGTATASVTLTTAWQPVTVTYTVRSPGASSLDYSAKVAGVPARTAAFYADDAVLSL